MMNGDDAIYENSPTAAITIVNALNEYVGFLKTFPRETNVEKTLLLLLFAKGSDSFSR